MSSNTLFTNLIENIINNEEYKNNFISWLNHIDNEKFDSLTRENFCNLYIDFLKINISRNTDENSSHENVKEIKTINLLTSTPKRKQNQNSHNNKSPLSLCLGDFLTNSQSKNKQKSKSSRRINPTQVSTSSNAQFEPTYFTGHKDNFVEERALLKLHRNKEPNPSNITNTENVKFSSNNLFLPQDEITNKLALDVLSELYSILCNNNLVHDKLYQLNFILSIISLNSFAKTFENKYFNSLQNCLYFAYKSLELSKLWVLFDMTALKALISNPRTEHFNPVLFTELMSKIGLQEKEFVMPLLEKKVIFEFDQESRSTFPNDNCFSTFRKQRDIFYEILITWEQQHQYNPQLFETHLISKIKKLIGLSNEPTNYFHLANLIKNQLIASCISSYFEKSQEIDSDLKATLNTDNNDKISRLEQRFTKPQTYISSKGITFPHFQEFFQKFFIYSSNIIFLTHMRDVLIAEILNLDTNHFIGLEFQDSENLIDPYTRGKYLKTVLTLKLLAKFLGLIIFMPYKTSLSLPNNIIKFETNIRKFAHPNFDINKYLNESIVHRRLVLTIPWVVEYLLMIDHASLSLPYYNETLNTLYYLYRFLPYFESLIITSDFTSLFLSLSIGWLFSQNIYEMTKLYFLKDASALEKFPFLDYINKETRSLDSLQLISLSSLRICCPFIEETKIKNLEYKFGHSKHITPIPAISALKSNIQNTLEENFITSQPSSIRQTLNFIIDKVSSKIIRKITVNWWPEAQTKALTNDKPENIGTVQRDGLKFFNESINNELPKLCSELVKTSLYSLLPDDTSNVVMNHLVRITCKKIKDKLDTWFESNFNEAHRISEIRKKYEKLKKKENKNFQNVLPNCCLHSDEAMSPTNCLLFMMNISSLLINQPENLSEQDIIMGIRNIRNSSRHREDLQNQSSKRFGYLSIDQVILILSYKPLCFNQSLLKEYALFWKILDHSFRSELFVRVVSPRNLMILAQSKVNPNDSWSKYGYLINYLLEKKFISTKKLERQCLSILRTEWPQSISLRFAKCLQEVIQSHKTKIKQDDSKFLLLLELVTDICSDEF